MMTARRVLALACVAVLAAPAALAGQGLTRLKAGDRVRLTAPSIGVVQRQTFTLVDVTADSITLTPEGRSLTLDCALADVTSLQVQRGRKRATLRGLGIGALAGAAIGVAAGFADGDDPPDAFIAMTAGEKAVAAGLALGGLGGVVGALIGTAVKVDRWDKIPLTDVRVGLSESGAAAFAVSASLRL